MSADINRAMLFRMLWVPTIWNSVLSARRDSHLILNNHLYSPRIVDNTDKTTKKHERSGSNNMSS